MSKKLIVVLAAALLALAACGKKPADVSAPEGSDEPYPRTYPSE